MKIGKWDTVNNLIFFVKGDLGAKKTWSFLHEAVRAKTAFGNLFMYLEKKKMIFIERKPPLLLSVTVCQ